MDAICLCDYIAICMHIASYILYIYSGEFGKFTLMSIGKERFGEWIDSAKRQ